MAIIPEDRGSGPINYKQMYRELKKKLRILISENECFKIELRKTQSHFVQANLDNEFLLNRLMMHETVDSDASDSDLSDSSEEEGTSAPHPHPHSGHDTTVASSIPTYSTSQINLPGIVIKQEPGTEPFAGTSSSSSSSFNIGQAAPTPPSGKGKKRNIPQDGDTPSNGAKKKRTTASNSGKGSSASSLSNLSSSSNSMTSNNGPNNNKLMSQPQTTTVLSTLVQGSSAPSSTVPSSSTSYSTVPMPRMMVPASAPSSAPISISSSGSMSSSVSGANGGRIELKAVSMGLNQLSSGSTSDQPANIVYVKQEQIQGQQQQQPQAASKHSVLHSGTGVVQGQGMAGNGAHHLITQPGQITMSTVSSLGHQDLLLPDSNLPNNLFQDSLDLDSFS